MVLAPFIQQYDYRYRSGGGAAATVHCGGAAPAVAPLSSIGWQHLDAGQLRQGSSASNALRRMIESQSGQPLNSSGVSYSTTFSANESPMVEDGNWRLGAREGLDWTDVNTSGGYAFGTQALSGVTFDDSLACRTGFGANHTASGVIHLDGTLASDTHEVEILLRFSIGAHDAHGYEINLAYDGGYTEIMRWNGSLGSFTPLAQPGAISGGAPSEGDILTAQISGNIITVWLNRVATTGIQQINSVDITSGAGAGLVFSSGGPGLGFWHGGSAAHYAFTSWSATQLP